MQRFPGWGLKNLSVLGLSIQGVDGYEREQVVSSLDGTVAHHCLQAQPLYQGTYTKQQVT